MNRKPPFLSHPNPPFYFVGGFIPQAPAFGVVEREVEFEGDGHKMNRQELLKKARQRFLSTPHPLAPSLREGGIFVKGFALLIPQGSRGA